MHVRTFEGRHSSCAIVRPRGAVVTMVITGRDPGEHGDGPLRALDEQLVMGPYALFIDARAVAGTSVDGSNLWAQWLRARRDQLESIHMLTGAPFVQLTADFVRRWAELGDALRIYTDAAAFDAALASRS